MADDTQKRTLLDQLTTNAATPQSDVPAPLTPALSDPTAAGGTVAPPLPMGTSATTTGSTANLESAADDSTNPAAKAAATAKGEDTGGFLSKLGRIASGMSGLGDPNSSPDAGLGSRVGSLVGRVGNGLAVAAGTPEQKQIGEENSQVPLKLAQIQNEQQYRRAVVGNAMQKESDQYGNGADGQPVGTSRISAGANAQRAANQGALVDPRIAQMEADTNKKNFELLTLQQGQFPMDPATAHLINRPDLINADGTGKPVSAAFMKSIEPVLQARGLHVQDIPSGPNEPGGIFVVDKSGRKINQISSTSAVDARMQGYLQRTQLPANDAQGNLLGWVNPQTNTFTSVGDVHGKGSGQSLPEALGSNVIPPKPTASVLNRGQVAQTILPQIPIIQKEVSDLADQIGAVGGRWNDFWVNKGGKDNPKFAGLDQDLQLYATAVGMAHFGAGMPEGFVRDMMKDFGEAQSPEDLSSRIEHAEGWVRGYANRVGGGPKTASSSSGTPAKPTSGGGGFSAWDKNNPAPKTAGAK